MRSLFAAAAIILFSTFASAADIPRDGKVTVPSKQTAIAICKKNPFITGNTLLRGCVQMELQSAEKVLTMISREKEAASAAYWVCVENQFIDTYTLLSGCMQQEMEAGAYLNQ